jgi:hypothetical protein
MNITLKHITGPKNGAGLFKMIQTAEDYERLLHMNPLNQEVFVSHNSPLTAVVYINHSRLLIDCNCGCGALVDAQWEMACCFECGAIYRSANLVFPSREDLLLLDGVLGMRHPNHRNYHPERETLASVMYVDGVL